MPPVTSTWFDAVTIERRGDLSNPNPEVRNNFIRARTAASPSWWPNGFRPSQYPSFTFIRWRAPCEQRLPDGSYLSRIYPSPQDQRRQRNGVVVRVIEYRLEGVEGSEPLYRLATTILDHERAPATELAALYHDRWEIETAFDELKTHLRGARIVLRSKTPDLVRQEFYGLLMAHFAIRGLMHEAALESGEDPDRLSFLHAVRVVRRKIATFGAIPPSGPEEVP